MFSSVSRVPASRLIAAASVSAAAGYFTFSPNELSVGNVAGIEGQRVALSKSQFTALQVSKNEVIGKHVHKITLDFPHPSDTLGMTTAGMLMVEGAKRDGSGVVARPYTPVSRSDTVGILELVVKDYPGSGNVSTHMCRAKVGSTLSVKGCFTKIPVTRNKWKKVGLIAGGSGITPCLQVAEEILSDPEDRTKITLIFCNQTPGDVFLRDHIDALSRKAEGRLKVYYCVDRAPSSDGYWRGLTGYVTKDMIKCLLPNADGANNMIMVCGPPPMYEAVCGPKLFEKGKPPAQGEVGGFLKDLGFSSDAVFKF
eukprot:CAMPEP_0194281260 /NCGR_PEP_ID=MMETSP0169-20130528/20378_1 /TAXON_ID=218684 /ORGANISM="Corethron pennatum, Strain L29A3" /LENGTH=310 /DNA_ID=CAMNT_0039026271 /DNA_START=27 /DNA_END=959 /DNA_ORIENTATION=+